MTTTRRRKYNVKRIDEFGECYNEMELGIRERNQLIREWLGGDTNHTRTYSKDVVVITKQNGEELWFYELDT